MKTIEVNKVSYTYKGKTILSDVSLLVEEGDTFALLGENGSGKSTLIDVILGDITLSSGTIQVFGKTKPNFKKIGVVYDHLPFFPLLKVKEIISYFAAIYGVSASEVYEKYKVVFRLETIYESHIQQLSQGEKKRLAIMLSLLGNPKLLILDEPFSHIDPTIINSIWSVLKSENRTILYTTHDWGAIAQQANKVAFIRDGKMTGIPLDTSTFKEQLPGSKKIVTRYDDNVKNILTEYNYYTTSDENVHIFCDDKDKSILSNIAKHTHNFSIQDTDIQDAYLYNTKNI
ncbi:ABC transporter ATP-binding protein [Bernardetia sp. OM2101]|uniref:ABC transporter ATP-binding protein n=1 Tax=Bernardetia sp. OM2101 TaxID=3344876 RepID=UPI0035D11CDF